MILTQAIFTSKMEAVIWKWVHGVGKVELSSWDLTSTKGLQLSGPKVLGPFPFYIQSDYN